MSTSENRERAQRLKLPNAVVGRIVKNALPDNAKMSSEARCVVSRAASVFVLNMATFATDHAQGKKRKMVTGEDVIAALKGLECERLEKKLTAMVESWKSKKADKAAEQAKKRADKKAAAVSEAINDVSAIPETEAADEEPTAASRDELDKSKDDAQDTEEPDRPSSAAGPEDDLPETAPLS
ncbi:unnamed protein product, partial [Mesorhabditis spiculigera]